MSPLRCALRSKAQRESDIKVEANWLNLDAFQMQARGAFNALQAGQDSRKHYFGTTGAAVSEAPYTWIFLDAAGTLIEPTEAVSAVYCRQRPAPSLSPLHPPVKKYFTVLSANSPFTLPPTGSPRCCPQIRPEARAHSFRRRRSGALPVSLPEMAAGVARPHPIQGRC